MSLSRVGGGPSPAAQHAALVSSAAFAIFSVLITIFNKLVLSTYGFDGPLTLTALQSAATLVILQVWSRLSKGAVRLPKFSKDTVSAVAPLSVIFVLKLATSMISIGRANLPMFTTLRQTALLFVIVEEWLYFRTWPNKQVWTSVAMICGGALIAALKDLTFDLGAYAYIFAANLFASLYAVNIKATRERAGLDVVGLLAYNTWLTLPMLVLLAVVTGDAGRALAFPGLFRLDFLFVFTLAIGMSFSLNLALFYCTTLTSATTKTVISGLKSVATILLGMVLFTDYKVSHGGPEADAVLLGRRQPVAQRV